MSVPTPHISAKLGDFSKTVLMPGDPLRAKFIADNFLTEPSLVNEVRGILGYTGTFNGVPVSVMASGMGIPSMGIYSYELFNFYNVENIIRIGSAGAISDKLQLRDLVAGIAASTNSNYGKQFNLKGSFAPCADYQLLHDAVSSAKEQGLNIQVGNLLSADNFYNDCPNDMDDWRKMGVLAVEMEAAGLYLNAARAGKRALCICTISDHIYRNEALSAMDRQSSFNQMIQVALAVAVKAHQY